MEEKSFENNGSWDRFLDKMELEGRADSFDNILDSPLDTLISEQKKQIAYWKSKLAELEKAADNPNSEDEEEHIQNQLEDFYLVKEQKIEELYALFEIKVIYAYKNLEITLKNLINSFYKEDAMLKNFKWETFIAFSKMKGLEVKSLEGYPEVDQLRNANNSFKHSGNAVNDSIRNITEFKDEDFLESEHIEAFYERIKDTPKVFLGSLINEIKIDLFDFSERKIENLADNYARRMEPETAKKFVEALLSRYTF